VLQHAVNAAWGTVKYDIAGYREARDELLAWHEANPVDERQGSLI
jgi:endonuclease I